MKEDNLIKIVNEIYNGHREALDFILENKPDRIVDAFDVIMEEVSNAGYKPASSSKGYVRFLTEDLDKIIPRTGRELKNKESFVFEIEFWGQKITLKTLIPPGEQKDRYVLFLLRQLVHSKAQRNQRDWHGWFILVGRRTLMLRMKNINNRIFYIKTLRIL